MALACPATPARGYLAGRIVFCYVVLLTRILAHWHPWILWVGRLLYRSRTNGHEGGAVSGEQAKATARIVDAKPRLELAGRTG